MEKRDGYYENPVLANQLHGQADSFFGEPFFGFGDLLDILFTGQDEENMQKVMQWFAVAENAGHYQLDNFTGLYFDYPNSDVLLGLQYALGKEDEETTFRIEYFYPLMQGYAQSLEILATFDWPDKVCGYVAIAWRDKVPLNCFAQSYRLWSDKIIFGQHIQFALSGMALQIGHATMTQFSVHKGQFYEMNLAQFLDENPDKTEDDFEAPVIHMENSVILVPREVTCLYEMQVPVRKVESVIFDHKKFTRLLVPIVRDWENGEELLAWIYVGEKEMGDFRPEPGDLVQGVIMLCTCPVDVNVQ